MVFLPVTRVDEIVFADISQKNYKDTCMGSCKSPKSPLCVCNLCSAVSQFFVCPYFGTLARNEVNDKCAAFIYVRADVLARK